MITLRIVGEPAPQGSKARGRNGGLYEMSKKVKPWRDAVKAAAFDWMASQGDAIPYAEPVELTITFFLARPAGHYRANGMLRPSAPAWPSTRPDTSKLIRSTEDALTDARIWGDDGRVVYIKAIKSYAVRGTQPGAVIRIRSMDEAEAEALGVAE